MKSCRNWRSHLVDAIYGELTDRRAAELDTHLASCPRCAAELGSLQRTATVVDEMLPPKPENLAIWNRIAPEIAALERPSRGMRPRLDLGYPTAAAFAAAFLLMGLGLGALLRVSAPPPVTSSEVVAEISAADVAVDVGFARFLERATPLLLAVANRQTGTAEVGSIDPSAERRLAERLAEEAATLTSDLETAGRRRQAALISDLEVVFLQMSNLPERQYRRGIEIVRATIESRALLFQLSVEEMRHL